MNSIRKYFHKADQIGHARALWASLYRLKSYMRGRPKPRAMPSWRYVEAQRGSLNLGFLVADRMAATKKADALVAHRFAVLGSGELLLDPISWHEDVRLKSRNPQADYCFDGTSHYKEIQISNTYGPELGKDIKVPWELSRFQFLPVLAYAYTSTGNDEYVHTIQDLIND